MKKIAIIIIVVMWIASLAILIIALTNIVQNNPFKEYRLIIGIGFIAITRFLGKAYNQVIKTT